jgi:hypothetical protein
MITKNKTQLNYLYGEEVVQTLENTIKDTIKSGHIVTIDVDTLDEVTDEHLKIAKIKLFIKRLFI